MENEFNANNYLDPHYINENGDLVDGEDFDDEIDGDFNVVLAIEIGNLHDNSWEVVVTVAGSNGINDMNS